MVCVVVCADRGAPGATMAALALGTAWPTPEPALVVEADPYGGAIPLRCNTTRRREWLPESPTVLAAAASAVASRGVPSGEVVTQYAHRFSDRVQVVVGHRVAEQARGISDWGPLGQALRAVGGPVIVDLGRIHAASPSMKIAAAAHIVVLVARGDVPDVLNMRARLEALVPALAEELGRPPRGGTGPAHSPYGGRWPGQSAADGARRQRGRPVHRRHRVHRMGPGWGRAARGRRDR